MGKDVRTTHLLRIIFTTRVKHVAGEKNRGQVKGPGARLNIILDTMMGQNKIMTTGNVYNSMENLKYE